jgi:hypothetical protein
MRRTTVAEDNSSSSHFEGSSDQHAGPSEKKICGPVGLPIFLGATMLEDEKKFRESSATDASQCCSLAVTSRGRRKDMGRLHAVRHGALSRYPIEALRHLGEDPKSLRRLERRFQAELKPQGAIADLVFDRFWSSYLRCLLAARTEATVFRRQGQNSSQGKTKARLLDGAFPTLVVEQSPEPVLMPAPLGAETLHHLALVQRYDRHFGKEMYGALALLLVLRSSGEAGLEDALAKIFGIRG